MMHRRLRSKKPKKGQVIVVSSEEEESPVMDPSRDLFDNENVDSDVTSDDESIQVDHSKELFSQCQSDNFDPFNIDDCNVVLNDCRKNDICSNKLTGYCHMNNFISSAADNVNDSNICLAKLAVRYHKKDTTKANESDMCLADLAELKRTGDKSNESDLCLAEIADKYCKNNVLSTGNRVNESDLCLANLAELKRTGDESNESDLCLAEIAEIAELKTNTKKSYNEDSITCFENIENVKKFKTFKTYGKSKWHRRKLSIEWTSAKKVAKEAIISNAYVKRRNWVDLDKIEVENNNDNENEASYNGMNDKDEINCTPKHCRVLTPSNQENMIGSPAVHSTPLTRTKSCTHTPKKSMKYINELSLINDSPCGFNRTVFVTTVGNNSNLHSFRNIDKPNPFASLSLLKADSFISLKESSLIVPVETRILNLCEQESILNFKDYVSNCKFTEKIAEGSYGEVFERKDELGKVVIVKIVPVGLKDVLVNGIPQMSLEEIIPEMVISKTLSNLKEVNDNNLIYKTEGFVQIHRLVFCKGKYPQRLVRLWDCWDSENESENTNPRKLNSNQMYVVFETDYGGVDLEHFRIRSQIVALSILRQAILSLAIAERVYQFEHRDLHWGNILIMETNKDTVDFTLENKEYIFECHGVLVSVIDFTVSRVKGDGCVVFTELCNEVDLFEGKGDIQFNVYRDMKAHNNNDWLLFNPYTNVLWIHYLVKKLISRCRYASRLKRFERSVLVHKSAYDILMSNEVMND